MSDNFMNSFYKSMAHGFILFCVFAFSAAFGRMQIKDSCNERGMFTYNDHVYKCTEIKP